MKRLLKKLFGCPSDGDLVTVWRVKEEVQALGQIVYSTKIKLGSYTILKWTTYYTPIAD